MKCKKSASVVEIIMEFGLDIGKKKWLQLSNQGMKARNWGFQTSIIAMLYLQTTSIRKANFGRNFLY